MAINLKCRVKCPADQTVQVIHLTPKSRLPQLFQMTSSHYACWETLIFSSIETYMEKFCVRFFTFQKEDNKI